MVVIFLIGEATLETVNVDVWCACFRNREWMVQGTGNKLEVSTEQ